MQRCTCDINILSWKKKIRDKLWNMGILSFSFRYIVYFGTQYLSVIKLWYKNSLDFYCLFFYFSLAGKFNIIDIHVGARLSDPRDREKTVECLFPEGRKFDPTRSLILIRRNLCLAQGLIQGCKTWLPFYRVSSLKIEHFCWLL